MNDFQSPKWSGEDSSPKLKLNPSGILPLIAAGAIGAMLTLVIYGFFVRTDGGISGGNIINQNLTVEEESATVKTVAKTLPGVVGIISKENVKSVFGGIYEQKGGGSGFIISSDGLIVTNKHVVSSEGAAYTVVTNDGKDYEAEVIARDPVVDLALVRIKAKDLPVVELGDSDKLELGQKLIAIGNALGEYQNSVTTGVVSGIGRVITAADGSGSSERLEGVIQTDAAINPGNSGGPLINLAGQVVGINTAIDQEGRLIGFAIPINSVKSAIDMVMAGGEIVRPKLGLRFVLITKEMAALNKMEVTEGALVARGDTARDVAVQQGGPADLAGIKEGDIIISLDNDKVTEKQSLTTILQKHKPGDSVAVKLIREGKEKTVTVKLGKL